VKSNSTKDIPPDVLAKLEQRGVDSVRALLTGVADGMHGTGRGAAIPMDGIYVSRAHMEDWLRSKEAISARWIKTGAVAAIIAAILAFLSWAFPIK
jgi:hypothetical protein